MGILEMDWTITATIITLVLASVTAIGVWLGPKWTENTRRRYEARQSHLARLKDGVIRPLLHQLAYYYVPLCTNQKSNIIGKSVLVNIPNAPLTEFNMDRQTQLRIFSIDDIIEDWQEEEWMRDFDAKTPIRRDNLGVDKDLYEDLRDNHETRLMERWEAFVSKFAEYNELCLKYVENIAKQLVEESQVPDWTAQVFKGGLRRGINAAGLASYVWVRQLDISSDWLRIGGKEDTFQMTTGNEVTAIGTEQEMNNLLALVEKLVAERSNVIELQEIKSRMKIEEITDSMLRELKDFELSNRLKGSCGYTKI